MIKLFLYIYFAFACLLCTFYLLATFYSFFLASGHLKIVWNLIFLLLSALQARQKEIAEAVGDLNFVDLEKPVEFSPDDALLVANKKETVKVIFSM